MCNILYDLWPWNYYKYKNHCLCSHEIPFVNPLFIVYVVCRCFILFFSGELCSTNGTWLPTHTAFPPSASWETRTQQMSHRDIENISTLFSKLCGVIHICWYPQIICSTCTPNTGVPKSAHRSTLFWSSLWWLHMIHSSFKEHGKIIINDVKEGQIKLSKSEWIHSSAPGL